MLVALRRRDGHEVEPPGHRVRREFGLAVDDGGAGEHATRAVVEHVHHVAPEGECDGEAMARRVVGQAEDDIVPGERDAQRAQEPARRARVHADG